VEMSLTCCKAGASRLRIASCCNHSATNHITTTSGFLQARNRQFLSRSFPKCSLKQLLEFQGRPSTATISMNFNLEWKLQVLLNHNHRVVNILLILPPALSYWLLYLHAIADPTRGKLIW
jgi:hypothetical protein